MKEYFNILLFLLFSSVISGQQFSNPNILSTEKVDSVVISSVHYADKITELPTRYEKDSVSGMEYPVYEKVKNSQDISKKKKLSTREILSLNLFKVKNL